MTKNVAWSQRKAAAVVICQAKVHDLGSSKVQDDQNSGGDVAC